VDTNQRRDAPDVKTHEEILSLLRELDILEKRVKNLQLPDDSHSDADVSLQEVERTEQYAETIVEPHSEVPIDTIKQEAQQEKIRLPLLKHHKTKRAVTKEARRSLFPHKKQPVSYLPKTTTRRHLRTRNAPEKPVQSTFKLYVTEEGALAGLDMQRPKPPKPQIRLFGRHYKTETSEQRQEVQEPGFKGRMKRLVTKIVPHRSKNAEASTGIGSRLKGIVKRKPKEQK
jgi:hypothetical protein